jgi:hypothetical protein
MAEFLTTKGICARIEEIIIDAKKQITIVSPYLKLSEIFTDRLIETANRNIPINIVYGKTELDIRQSTTLQKMRTLRIYYYQNLHAKCYFNESKMVIGSMNLYEYSERNREMGVSLDYNVDRELFEKAKAEVGSILKAGDKETHIEQHFMCTNAKHKHGSGYCIRCEDRIRFNPERPLCADCYSVWAQFQNYSFEEYVCHRCGEYEVTSMEKPQCYTCYSRA